MATGSGGSPRTCGAFGPRGDEATCGLWHVSQLDLVNRSIRVPVGRELG